MSELRVGIGIDAHAFSDEAKLVLGGVEISGRGLAGHSDGDVVSHALIDAILGAAGLEDIGALFPSGEAQWEGASSLDLLRRAYEDAMEGGWELVNADCVLIGEEPRIARTALRPGLRRLVRPRGGGGGVGRRGQRAAELFHERDGVLDRLGDRILARFGPRGRVVLRAGYRRDKEDSGHAEKRYAHG